MTPFWLRNRAIIALAIVSAVAECAYAAVNTLALPFFLTDELKIVEEMGVVIGTFLLFEALFKSPMGALSDRFGRRLFLTAAPILSALTALGIASVHGPVTGERIFGFILNPMFFALLGLRALDGLAAAAIWPTMYATMADQVEEERQTSAMSVLTVSYMVGLGMGPLLGGLATRFMGSPRAPFLVVSVLFLLTAAAAYLLVPRQRHHSYAELHAGQAPHADTTEFRLSSLLHSVRTIPLMLAMALIVFLGAGLLYPTTPLYARAKFNLNEEAFGRLFVVPAAIIGLAALPLGKLGDRWGEARSVHLGMALCVLSLWGLAAVSGSEWYLVGLATVLGLGFAVGVPAWMSSVAEKAGDQRRGEVIGAVQTAQGIGVFLGVLIGPKLYSMHVEAPVIASACFLTAGFILSLITVRDRSPGSGQASAVGRGEKPSLTTHG
jgi:DHA1 family multidrug resistance protein-like MFS transporter